MPNEVYAYFEGSTGDDKRICPISKVIEVNAAFAGRDTEFYTNDDMFCRFESPYYLSPDNLYLSRHEYHMSFLFLKRSHSPNECNRTYHAVKNKLFTIDKADSYEGMLSFEEINNLPVSEEEKFKVSVDIQPKMEEKKKAEGIISEWRWIIYDLLENEEEANNHHFSEYKREDLTDEVVVSIVRKLHSELDTLRLGQGQERDCYSDFTKIEEFLKENDNTVQEAKPEEVTPPLEESKPEEPL